MTDLDALIREREAGEWWQNRRTIDPKSDGKWKLPRQPPRDTKHTAA